MTQVEIQHENLFFKKKNPKPKIWEWIMVIFISSLAISMLLTVSNTYTTIKSNENIVIKNNIPLKLSNEQFQNMTNFIQENKINEIKIINIVYWKLQYIKKTNPTKVFKVNLDSMLSFTQEYYSQIQTDFNNQQKINNPQKLTIENVASQNRIQEWVINEKSKSMYLNPKYTEFINEPLINSAITDKGAFANYLADNKFDIQNTENLLLNHYNEIKEKRDYTKENISLNQKIINKQKAYTNEQKAYAKIYAKALIDMQIQALSLH